MLTIEDWDPRCERLGARARPARVSGGGRAWVLQTVWKPRSVVCNMLYCKTNEVGPWKA
jgi:hypothetical protein